MRVCLLALVLVLACGRESTREQPAAHEPAPSPPARDVPASAPAAAPSDARADARAPSCVLVEPPAGFVDLRERIPGVEIVAGYHRADNFTGAPLPGYEAVGAWFDADAAEALARAAERLAADDRALLVYDAYRPRRASEAMVAWARAQGRTSLLDEGWVAARSLHNRGVAIDVGLVRASDRARIDMGTDWDHFGPRSWLRGVEGPPLRERLRLREAMLAAGFEPYAREWWHFTWRGEPGPARDDPYRCRL
jgi:D-alanyl-D-alanine dipeptidase